MSGPLPPVPDLIPISVLLKGSSAVNNSGAREVMGEQRSRRTGNQPSVDLIDSVQSRAPSAAPASHQSRKARSERHRKSDRRREHRKPARTRSSSKHSSKSRDTPSSSPERPANPRVNPIFVWVRQEDTRIVDVKCEDYDKRNRILLTKTAQGWRAIPRTETLVPSTKDDKQHHHHHHHHHRNRKRRKSKVRRKSAAVQVDCDFQELNQDYNYQATPTWNSPINIESHLPSHNIIVPKKCPSPDNDTDLDSPCVNSAVSSTAQMQEDDSSKICDATSPLENLLAVAEFEFNHQTWKSNSGNNDEIPNEQNVSDEDNKDFIANMEQLIESCSKPENKLDGTKTEECDYNEEDDNNIAMDDILNRLEQSLRSPDCVEVTNPLNECETIEIDSKDSTDLQETKFQTVPELETCQQELEKDPKNDIDKAIDETCIVDLVESLDEDGPTDLSIKSKRNDNILENLEMPTDLSVPRSTDESLPTVLSPRPQSRNSETIQSPQPSGIPAVPPSPDIVSPSANSNSKTKSIFLESLLTHNQKIPSNSDEVTMIRQKEPLDLGKSRKSASPTITCSEEVKNKSESEPPVKKFKSVDITLKTLLDVELKKTKPADKSAEKSNSLETPKLLELLKTDSEQDPLAQLRQILCDASVSIPDPMLVPKERLSQIISHPAREIPRLLKQRPELRLPEALAFPHLLQDPDILVITLQQLETIILKQNQSMNLKVLKSDLERDIKEKQNKRLSLEKPLQEVVTKEVVPLSAKKKALDEHITKIMNNHDQQGKNNFNELASDIDAATTAAFSQMLWLPYLNQLEAMSFGNNPEVMKLLSNSMPMIPNQVPDINHLRGANRFPPPINFNFPQSAVNYNNNPLELQMWQEAMMQANMLRPNNPFDGVSPKNSFRDYVDKFNFAASAKKQPTNNKQLMSNNKSNMPNFYPPANISSSYQNSFLGMPSSYQLPNSSKQILHTPRYNSLYSPTTQKNSSNPHRSQSHPYLHKAPQMFEPPTSKTNFYNQLRVDEKQQSLHQRTHHHHQQRSKLSCKSFSNVPHQKTDVGDQTEKVLRDLSKNYQPIDLSGSTTPSSKMKVKHLIDPVANTSKLLKHDDVPEVGSTTASIEDMQDAHKHLWHPLFGNQKSYNNPWNWTTVTATGE